MREVAEKLIEAMAMALEGKKAGAPGNFEGIINQTMRTLETAVQASSGNDPALRGMIARAKKIQLEAARTVTGASKRVSSGADPGGRVSLAGAFEFQKKRPSMTTPPVVAAPEVKVNDTEGTEPGGLVSVPGGEEEPAAVSLPAGEVDGGADLTLVRSLAGMKVQELVANFGGMEGLRVFAFEMFKASQRDGEPDSRFVGRVRGLLKQMAKGDVRN